jgi:hypothetical protein
MTLGGEYKNIARPSIVPSFIISLFNISFQLELTTSITKLPAKVKTWPQKQLQSLQRSTQDPATAAQTPSPSLSPHLSRTQNQQVTPYPLLPSLYPNLTPPVINCNCSICAKNGYLLTFVPTSSVTWTKGTTMPPSSNRDYL